MARSAPRRPWLVALDRLPMGRGLPDARLRGLLRALSKLGARLTLCVTGPSESEARRFAFGTGRGVRVAGLGVEAAVAALREAAAQAAPAAVLLLDSPATARLVRGLGRSLGRSPLVLAAWPDGGDGAVSKYDPARVDELWWFGSPPQRRVSAWLPSRFFALPEGGSAALAARVRAVEAGPRADAKRDPTSVIIPCWNGLAYTRQCVESVRRWTDAPYEIVAVDNGSRDGTADYLRALKGPRLRVIRNPENRGFARAINQGMAAARGRYLLWLNNDAVATPGWLGRLIDCAERAPWIGAVGPLTNEINGVQRVACSASLSQVPVFAESLALANAGRTRPVHRLTGFCLLLKREVFERVGALDEGFGLGTYEDFDYCLRMRMAGFELMLAEDVFVYHHGHKTFTGAGLPVAKLNETNRELFIEKWCRRALTFLDEIDPHIAGARRARRRF